MKFYKMGFVDALYSLIYLINERELAIDSSQIDSEEGQMFAQSHFASPVKIPCISRPK